MKIKAVKCSVVTPSELVWMGVNHNCFSLENCEKQLSFAPSKTEKTVFYFYTYVRASMIFSPPLST